MIVIKGIRAPSTDINSITLSNVRMQHVMSDTTAVTWNAPARYLYLACKYAGHVTPICSTTTAMLGVV